jgi:exosortase/archaeosortase family protein
MRAVLNARIGRTMPTPLFAVAVDGPQLKAAGFAGTLAARSRAAGSGQPGWLLGALLLALWPHGVYLVRRFIDGSDEPWGILALLTVIALVARDRAQLGMPSGAALVASALLAVCAAAAELMLPDLAAAALAMLAIATLLAGSLRRPATPLFPLLLLALPIIASLQFYLGFPLRQLVAHSGALLLTLAGWPAQANGAAIVHDGITVLVDAPCAGIGMLWIGSYTAALLSYLARAGAGRTLFNALAGALLVFTANAVRSTVLFFPEAGLVDWPAASHEAVGLAALLAALVPLAALALRRPA